MGIIINELEVVTEAPPEAAAAQGDTQRGAALLAGASSVSPQDVATIVQHQAERAARLYAG